MVLVEAGSTAASTVRASAGYSEDATIVASAGLLSRTGHIFREGLKMSRELSDHFSGRDSPGCPQYVTVTFSGRQFTLNVLELAVHRDFVRTRSLLAGIGQDLNFWERNITLSGKDHSLNSSR